MAVDGYRRNIGKTALFPPFGWENGFLYWLVSRFSSGCKVFSFYGAIVPNSPLYGEIIRGCVNREKKSPPKWGLYRKRIAKKIKKKRPYKGALFLIVIREIENNGKR